MRGASLADPTVIDLLNGYFVPVFVSNEDYAATGPASGAEKAELHRIFAEGYAKKLSVGTVHVYILAPDGHLLDSMHVAQASQPALLAGMLRRNVERLHTVRGGPAVAPEPARMPACPVGDVLLHVTARYLERRDGALQPILNGGDWSAVPAEDWIALPPAEAAGLLPRNRAALRPGTEWEVDPRVASNLLSHFYPPTENWDPAANAIDHKALRGTVESVRDGVARARYEGSLEMAHSFYHRPDDRRVQASVAGFVDFEVATGRIRRLELVTVDATYDGSGTSLPFGVAVALSR